MTDEKGRAVWLKDVRPALALRIFKVWEHLAGPDGPDLEATVIGEGRAVALTASVTVGGRRLRMSASVTLREVDETPSVEEMFALRLGLMLRSFRQAGWDPPCR